MKSCVSVLLIVTFFTNPLALASVHRGQNPKKSMALDISRYVDLQVDATKTLTSEAEFTSAWNAPEREKVREQDKGLIDLSLVYELNDEAAQIWDDVRRCHAQAENVEADSRTGYLLGELCPSDNGETLALQARIQALQQKIDKFASSTWIGGNDIRNALNTGRRVELPASHPFFNQLLMERVSVWLSPWGSEIATVEVNPPVRVRETDKLSDGDLESNAALANLLLMGAVPSQNNPDSGGFYACPALHILNIALGHFSGEALWRTSLNQLQNDLVVACSAQRAAVVEKNKDNRWDDLDVYHTLSVRYGGPRPKSSFKPNWGFILVNVLTPESLLSNTFSYRGHRFVILMCTVLLPMVLVSEILNGQKLTCIYPAQQDPKDI